jgi:hypothetical protein
MSIEEGNKLIDIFMEETPCDDSQYHSSWDWLMEVVEKIENKLKWKYCVEIINNLYWPSGNMYECLIYDEGNALRLEGFQSESKINVVWQAVIEFIQWFNKNTNP